MFEITYNEYAAHVGGKNDWDILDGMRSVLQKEFPALNVNLSFPMCHFPTYADNVEKVVFYPYRTARAFPIICTLPYNENTEDLQQFLAEFSQTRRDNHTVYEVFYKNDGGSICYWFSDNNLKIALKIHIDPPGS